MAKSKSQKVTVSLTFDQPVTKEEAVKEFRNLVRCYTRTHLYGKFYTGYYSEADVMKIRGVGPGPKNTRQI